MLQELIRHILSSIVEHKDAILVTQEHVEDKISFKITVDSRDIGRVIGRDGQTIGAIRSLVSVANPTQDTITVDICE